MIFDFFEKHSENDFVELFKSKNAGLGRDNNFDKRNAIYFPFWILGKGRWKRIIKRTYTEITGGYNKTFRWALRRQLEDLKFYFGSSWVCLSDRTLRWMLQYISDHPDYYQYMRNCNCPDESFFQTLLMNSPYAEYRLDYLHYVDWSEGKSNPKVLKKDDFDKLMASKKLMARKFDMTIDKCIINMLRERVSL